MQTEGLMAGWYIILGLNKKGKIEFKQLFESSITDIKKKVDKLNVLHTDLTYFGYKIKQTELL